MISIHSAECPGCACSTHRGNGPNRPASTNPPAETYYDKQNRNADNEGFETRTWHYISKHKCCHSGDTHSGPGKNNNVSNQPWNKNSFLFINPCAPIWAEKYACIKKKEEEEMSRRLKFSLLVLKLGVWLKVKDCISKSLTSNHIELFSFFT